MNAFKLEKQIRKAYRRMLQLQTKDSMIRHYKLIIQLELLIQWRQK